jgi:fructosamine-3-kinase
VRTAAAGRPFPGGRRFEKLFSRHRLLHLIKDPAIGCHNKLLLRQCFCGSDQLAGGTYCVSHIQQIARLHLWSDQPQFGLDFDNDLSTTPQPNAWQRRWSTFFAEQRIGWQLELAAEKGMEFGNIDAIVEHIHQRLASHQPQPSLLHGDLWSDNCALGPDGPYIFDPACYWGDRECDLAMLPLHPEQPPQIYDGYQSVSPLPADFLDRQPVYQLYTLMNRAILFGGQHLVNAQKALERVLAA